MTRDGVTAVVIAGEALGVVSPVYTRTPTHYLHFKMEPGIGILRLIYIHCVVNCYGYSGSDWLNL